MECVADQTEMRKAGFKANCTIFDYYCCIELNLKGNFKIKPQIKKFASYP